MNIHDFATTMSIVSTAIAIIISLGKWVSSLRAQQKAFEEQTRRTRLESAQIAWELANLLHEGPVASSALEVIDGETLTITTPQHGTHEFADSDLRNALASHPDQPALTAKDAAIRHTFDSMFYAFDRLRLAMQAQLISEDDISSATIYYCKKLVRTHGFVLDYGMIAYPATVGFIRKLASTLVEM